MNTTPVSLPSVDVLSLKPLPDAGGLKAFADIQIGPLIIHGVRLIQASASQSPFCAPPQNEVNKDGQRKFYPALTWPREWGFAVTRAVLDAYNEHPEGIAQVRGPRPGWPERPDGQRPDGQRPDGQRPDGQHAAFRREIREKARLNTGLNRKGDAHG